jgi:hypothetical protein
MPFDLGSDPEDDFFFVVLLFLVAMFACLPHWRVAGAKMFRSSLSKEESDILIA